MPNGALCFTNKDSSTIGRITTSGVDAEMPGERDHGQQPPSDHRGAGGQRLGLEHDREHHTSLIDRTGTSRRPSSSHNRSVASATMATSDFRQ